MSRIYKLFVMPACDKCTAVKEYLTEKGVPFELYVLTDEGMEEFRKYYPQVKEKVTRNEDGSLVIPILLVFDDSGSIINFANKIEEIKRIIENVPLVQ
jgi:glutaredoxin